MLPRESECSHKLTNIHQTNTSNAQLALYPPREMFSVRAWYLFSAAAEVSRVPAHLIQLYAHSP